MNRAYFNGLRAVAQAKADLEFFIDTFPNAAGAYGLIKLSSAVTNVARIRRSSDNAEQDFTQQEIENGTLASWVGSGNDGFITILYDQSGNNRDKTESNTNLQPWIVISGSLVMRGGKPAYYGNGSTRGRLVAVFNNTNTGDTQYSAITVGENMEGSQLLRHPFGIAPAVGGSNRNSILHLANDSSTVKSIRLVGGNMVYLATESGVIINGISYAGNAGDFVLRINGSLKTLTSSSNSGLNISSDSGFIFGNGRASINNNDYNQSPNCEAYGQVDIYYFDDKENDLVSMSNFLNKYYEVF